MSTSLSRHWVECESLPKVVARDNSELRADMATLPWLIVAEADGRIVAFGGLCHEEGETLEQYQAEWPDTFTGIERHIRSKVDGLGAFTWRYGTPAEALALGTRNHTVEHIICGFDYAPAIRKLLPPDDRCDCDRCRALGW
jgi:hypothetical protein